MGMGSSLLMIRARWISGVLLAFGALVEPSAGEREGPAPRMEEPSAGEREGPAPRMEEPSAGEREQGGWYLGVAAAADRQEFAYGKTVYTEAGLAQGVVTSADSDANRAALMFGGLAGYRWPLPGRRGLHLDVEVDAAWHPSKLKGHLEGTGHTWTDTWPEDWWLRGSVSYGLAVKLGGRLANSACNLYALAGLRTIATEFSITETGCPGPELQCPPTPLASFTEAVDRRFGARVFGVGLERPLGERHALQLEARRIDYQRKRWNRLFEGGVIIPSTVEGSENGVALRLIRRL